MAKSSINLVPLHRPILAGLVRRLSAETGLNPLLTFSDDYYDAFKLSDGHRSGPWCALRPTEFELPEGIGGRGLSTATRPTVWTEAAADAPDEYVDLGDWNRTEEALPDEPTRPAFKLILVDVGMDSNEDRDPSAPGRRYEMTIRVRADDASLLPTLRDSLVLGGPGANETLALVAREVSVVEPEPDDAPGFKTATVTLDSGLADRAEDEEALRALPGSGPVNVLRRRAESLRLLMTPAIIRLSVIYGTTDVQELMDFFSEWAFMRARNRLDFDLAYLGRTLPIKTVLGSSLSVPTKELPGDSGGYQVFEGDLEVHGFLTHDDPRDARIEPRTVDLELSLQREGLDAGADGAKLGTLSPGAGRSR